MRDIFGDPVEMTDEEMIAQLEREAELADQAFAEMEQHCFGCEYHKRIGCDRDIDEFPECPRDLENKKVGTVVAKQ